MLKNPFYVKLLWLGFVAALIAAGVTWMLNPGVPVKGLAWGLLGFAWFKLLLVKDIQWQRQHRPEDYATLVAHHGDEKALQSYIWYKVVALVALVVGACVCWALNWHK